MSNSVPVQAIAEDVYTAPQLTPEAMASAAEAGFKAVLNNRPDHEGGAGSADARRHRSSRQSSRARVRLFASAGGLPVA
jgi:uncharacterized protein (TIGR01244 family)